MAKSIKANCFDIVNTNGKPVLFRTDDVAINKFTFTIINLTGEPLALKGGVPDTAVRAKLAATSEASTFSIDFEMMLTAEVVAGLKLGLPANWAALYKPGDASTPPSWSLAPVADTTIGINEQVQFSMENIKCSDTRPGNFEIMYRNIPGYADLLFPIPKHLDVLTPPDASKKTLPIKDGYINPIHPITGQPIVLQQEEDAIKEEAAEAVPIYITYDASALIENGFTCILSNTSADPLVKPTDAVTAAEAPVVYLSFLFGEEDYAITTQSLADNNISIDIQAKLPWQTSAHTGGTSYWQFSPQSQAIMEGHETVYFPVRKIITPLNVKADAISLLYVQFNNIPGYNDAAYTLQLQKKTAVAKMEKLESDKYTITYGQDVRLTWTSLLAKRVTIDYENRDGTRTVLDSQKGDIKLNGTGFLLPVAPSADYTVIRATAYDNSNTSDSREITIIVKQVEAAIDSFTATPQFANLDGVHKADVVLSWEVSNTRILMLTTPEGREDVTGKTHVTKAVTGSFTFTLEAYSFGPNFPLPVSATRRVLGWKTGKAIPLACTREVQQTSPPIVLNNRPSRVFTFNEVNNTLYSINLRSGNLEDTLTGVRGMTLSDDGTLLFTIVPDKTYNAIVMYDVSTGTPINRGQVPLTFEYRQLLVSPDRKKLYCSFKYEHPGYIENYIFAFDVADYKWGRGKSVSLNHAPEFPGAMLLSRDAAKLYIVGDSQTLVVVRTSDYHLLPSVSLPSATAVTMIGLRSADKIYIACKTLNKVLVLNTQSDRIEDTIEVAASPVSLAISPDERYLCVACADADNIIVINTTTDKVAATIPVGNYPQGMSFTGDGRLLFVTNYCSKTLSAIDMRQLLAIGSTISTGAADGNPLAVAVFDDVSDYKVYITKESWPGRTTCTNPVKNTTDNISIFSILKPVDINNEAASHYAEETAN